MGDEVYQTRYADDLAKIEADDPDPSYQVHTLDLAKQVAMTRSFEDMVGSQEFLKLMSSNDGTRLYQAVEKWQRFFAGREEGVHLNIMEAIEKLRDEREFMPKATKIPCGILEVDQWLGGGLRTKNVALWMAPTGGGKSATMCFTAHYMSVMEEKKVWFITNELAWDQVTERFLARYSGCKMSEIMDDPIGSIASDGVSFIRSKGLGENLFLSEIPPGVSANDLEAHLAKMANIYGWAPDVIVIDYMERMAPVNKVGKETSWIYMGEIARDLCHLAKRRNIAIWSAIQTNRWGLSIGTKHGPKELSAEMAQGSIQHLQEVTAVVSLHILKETASKQVIEFKPLKMRESRLLPKPIKLVCNLETMTITPEKYEADEVDRSDQSATISSNQGRKKKPFGSR